MYADVTSFYSPYKLCSLNKGTAPTGLVSVLTEDHIVADPGRALAIDATIDPFVNASALCIVNRA